MAKRSTRTTKQSTAKKTKLSLLEEPLRSQVIAEDQRMKAAFAKLPRATPEETERLRQARRLFDRDMAREIAPERQPERTTERTSPPVKPVKRRPPVFTSKQANELQREQRRYVRDNPGAKKQDVADHLQTWAKATLKITASIRTIRRKMK